MLGTEELHHLATQHLIKNETSNCEEMWKIEMPLKDLQQPRKLSKCFQLL